MSASQIPNLNSLRRGGPRSRGRGRGIFTSNEDAASSSNSAKDEVIQKTDIDAATSRLSAVEAGYLDDPFARLLTPGPHTRRLPLMNRGTYARTTAIDKIVDTFLDACGPGKTQVISLGAGSDTRYFRLKQKQVNLDVIYHEFDFASNTKFKIAVITSLPFIDTTKRLCDIDFRSLVTEDGTRLQSPGYYIHPQDLRKLPEAIPGVDVTIPTLLISECCLVYLSPTEADAVLEYFSRLFADVSLAIAIYEPIRPDDAFGRTMVSNLTARGIQLQTLQKYSTLSAQKSRLQQYGFEGAAADVDFIWRRWLDEKEKERIESLEWMDEVEEFILFARHYCVAWDGGLSHLDSGLYYPRKMGVDRDRRFPDPGEVLNGTFLSLMPRPRTSNKSTD